ncbi:MAG TPA: non-homologous end-joining DNA ligase [Opitutaceae bacterium]|nr:non-homologous end-joining DNA ligase [Opitutaceae bacterium]
MPRSKPREKRAAAIARFVEPMKALAVADVPTGAWRTEIKFDGYRALAVLRAGKSELWSRNEKPLTADYPEVVAALRGVRCKSAVLDGEIVALDAEGRSRFQLLQQRGDAVGGRPPIHFYVFDLLQLNGESWMSSPIEERRTALEKLLGNSKGVVRLSPVFEIEPVLVLDEARRQGLEGIIVKQPGSLYEAGRRSGAWLKHRLSNEQEFVIGGFTPPRGGRRHFGAILVGYYAANGKLQYAGKVGAGFNGALLASLHREFEKRRSEASPFEGLPRDRSRWGVGMTAAVMKTVAWVRPELVAQVRFSEWTEDGLLRQPVFLGLRRDKPAREVVRETAPALHGKTRGKKNPSRKPAPQSNMSLIK